ncbi:MAG: 50S ribosomal protein L30 [Betaproteobacteria bacterium]|jgi:LSU ribosomal protein L30P|nr:50S ribosomal protein L30 [Betaproteobacteria bacterium]
MSESVTKSFKVTLTKSVIGSIREHRACVRGLGLRRMNHTVEVADTPENRGMAAKVSHLVRCA